MKKIAVIGGGIFGCLSAIELGKLEGMDVYLYDGAKHFFPNASGVNQYRLHRGYHYPRSIETVGQLQQSACDFEQRYANAIIKWPKHYYGISITDSKVTADEYLQFMDSNQLPYKIANNFNSNLSLTVEVEEYGFQLDKLWLDITYDLFMSGVKVINEYFTQRDFDKFDVVINATYADINRILPTEYQQDYQFELVEKVTVYTPPKYHGKSLVIMDGPFCCIDPIDMSGDLSVLGHVTEAIHDTVVGKWMDVDLTKIASKQSKIVKACGDLLECMIRPLKSNFVIRAVLPNRDHDDARPSLVTKHNEKLYSVFGGKISTSLDTAKELIKLIVN